MSSVRVGLLLLLIHLSVLNFAQVMSTFDVDADGWTLSDNNLTDPQIVNYNPTGGNPGGYISGTKISTSQPYYWTSPARFGGNIAYFSYGQDLSFDIQVNYVGTFHFNSGDVQIRTPGGSTLVYTLPSFPAQAPSWTTFTIRLDETAGWRINSASGALATKAQMLQYLSGVHSFRFNINYRSGLTSPTGAIDNVILGQRTISPSPSISSFAPTSGNPGASITINGSDFDPTPSNNVIYFGGMAGTITSASATSLTVTVPQGATYGPITVINKTTGRIKLSPKPFVPTFENGGRIIPASFEPKFDIAITGDYGGLAIVDIDGDGWNDLVTASEDNSGIGIYRNLGSGGDLTAASFAARVDFLTGGSGANGAGLRVIDLDGDGKLDMVTSIGRTAFVGSFATFRNISSPGNLAFEAVEYWDGKSDECPVYNAVDIDGDGLPELVGGEGAGAAGQNVWITQNISTSGNIEFGFSLFYFSSALDDSANGATITDLNDDGKPEFILVSGTSNNNITVFNNTSTPGLISFGTNFTIVQSVQGGINVADFNLDDKMDIAWKDGNSNDDIHIRINTNSGGAVIAGDLATEIIFDSEVTTYGALSIADINGDGRPDILATDNADVGIFENVYTGGAFNSSAFVPGYRFQGNGTSTYPSGAFAGDLNGDNKPDIIVGITNTNPNRLSIYENINERAPVISLNTVSPLQGPVGSTVIITGDYFSTTPSENLVQFGAVQANVVAATQTQLTVTVPPGANYGPVRVTRNQFTASYHLPFNPTFSAGVNFNSTHFAPPVSFTLTGGDFDIDVGDLNGDGKPDIMAEASNRAYSFRNTHTTGPITTSSLLADDSTTVNAQNPRLIDLNGDNKPEIIGSNGVFRNISSGSEITFEALTNIGGVLTSQPADFNRDGKFDYVGASGTAEVTLFENRMRQGAGAFLTGTYGSMSLAVDYPKPAAGGGPVAADFDNDGWMDMACSNGTTNNLTVWRNNGNYRVNLSTFASVGNFATGDIPGRLYTGDLDVDGKMDIVLYHGPGASSTMISVFHNTTTAVISFNRVDYTIPTAGTLAWISDLDGDGKPEILAGSETGNRIIILKNISSPGVMNASSFASPFSITVTAPRGLATGDINLDGKPEIIINTSSTLLIFENLVPTVSITITSQPGGITNRCEGTDYPFSTDATGTTNITYQWQKFSTVSSLFENLVNGGAYSNVTTKNLQITNMQTTESGDYRCFIQGDLATPVYSDTATLIVNPLPPEPVTTNGLRCGPGQVVLSATNGAPGEYVWYFDDVTGEPIPSENDSAYTTQALTTTTIFYVSLSSGICESARVPVTAIINPIPVKPVISSNVSPVGNTVTVCSSTALLLSAPTGFASYLWSDGSTTEQITVVASGTYTVTVTNAEACTGPASDALNVVIIPAPCNNQAPVISPTVTAVPIEGVVTIEVLDLISDPDDNLDLASLRVVTTTSQQGASASINGSNQLVLDYGSVPFSGTDHVTIEVCDLFGECTQQELTIEVIGDITVHNAFSPNGDGKNEIFLIEYIQLFSDTQENHVAIFNRWGDEVFSISNYNNNDRVFRGISSSGKELVSGTYFYKIEFSSGRKIKTGYLSLKR